MHACMIQETILTGSRPTYKHAAGDGLVPKASTIFSGNAWAPNQLSIMPIGLLRVDERYPGTHHQPPLVEHTSVLYCLESPLTANLERITYTLFVALVVHLVLSSSFSWFSSHLTFFELKMGVAPSTPSYPPSSYTLVQTVRISRILNDSLLWTA